MNYILIQKDTGMFQWIEQEDQSILDVFLKNSNYAYVAPIENTTAWFAIVRADEYTENEWFSNVHPDEDSACRWALKTLLKGSFSSGIKRRPWNSFTEYLRNKLK